MSERCARTSIAVATLMAAICVGATARAQDASALAAEALFSEGVQLMKANRCTEAVDKFRRSEHLEPASGTLLNLAYCEVQLGHRANAWLLYRQALPLARQNNKPDHERIAKDQASKLEGELGLLTVDVEATDDDNLGVRLDGEPIARDLWSVPIPVDPGPHTVDVYSGDRRISSYTVAPARGKLATVKIPRASTPGTAPGSVSAPPVTARHDPPKPEPGHDVAAPPGNDSTRTWAYVTGGVGIAALVTGGALFVSARTQYDSVAGSCPNNKCDTTSSYDARVSAITRARISAGVLAAGVVLVGASAVLWMQHPSSGDRGTSALVLDGTTLAWQRTW